MNEVTRVGNFKVCLDREDDFGWLVIATISNSWQVRYRADAPEYIQLLTLAHANDTQDYLEATIKTIYLATSVLPDLEYLKAFSALIKAFNERISKLVEATEKDDSDALEDVRRSEELDKLTEEKAKDLN